MYDRELLSALAVCLALACSLFLVGGAIPLGAHSAAILAILSALPMVFSRRRFASRQLLTGFLSICVVATALQCISLPRQVLAVISPKALELRDLAALASGGTEPLFAPLSLDAGASLGELAKFVSYWALAWVCLRLASRRRWRVFLCKVLALYGLALGAVGIGHYMISAQKLFGWYQPVGLSPRFVLPLLNSNHAGGYFAMAALLALTLSFRRVGSREALFWRVAALACAAFMLGRVSRGATLATGVGLVVFGVAYARQKQEGLAVFRASVRLGDKSPRLLVALGGLLALVALGASVWSELSGTHVHELLTPCSKFAAWGSAASLVAEFVWTGIGRGAFESVFPRVHELCPSQTFASLENEYWQAVVDWGLPLALLLGVVVAGLVKKLWSQGQKSVICAGAFSALLMLLVQNSVDFGLQLPGLAMPLVVLCAVAAKPRLKLLSPRAALCARWRRLALLGSALVACSLMAVSYVPLTRARSDFRAEIGELREVGEIESAARRFMQAHPADYYAPIESARVLLARRQPVSLRYANHALRLYPSFPGSHHLSARILRALGRAEQALVEYKLALVYGARLGPILQELSRAYSPAVVAEVLPVEGEHPLRVLRQLQHAKFWQAGLLYSERALTLAPDHPALLRYRVKFALAAAEPAEAVPRARRLFQLNPTVENSLLLARTLQAKGEPAEAINVLEETLFRAVSSEQRAEVLLLAAEYKVQLRRYEDARQLLGEVLRLAPIARKKRIQAHRLLAKIARMTGAPHRAEWEQSQVRELLEP